MLCHTKWGTLWCAVKGVIFERLYISPILFSMEEDEPNQRLLKRLGSNSSNQSTSDSTDSAESPDGSIGALRRNNR